MEDQCSRGALQEIIPRVLVRVDNVQPISALQFPNSGFKPKVSAETPPEPWRRNWRTILCKHAALRLRGFGPSPSLELYPP